MSLLGNNESSMFWSQAQAQSKPSKYATEMPVYPRLAETIGVDGGTLGIGSRTGGSLKIVLMREPDVPE